MVAESVKTEDGIISMERVRWLGRRLKGVRLSTSFEPRDSGILAGLCPFHGKPYHNGMPEIACASHA